MISFALEEEQELLRETCRDFAREQLRPLHRSAEESGEVPEGLKRAAHELGLTTMTLPEGVGGGGLDLVSRCIAEEELAHGDPGLVIGLPGPGAAGDAVLELGTDEQKQRYLAKFCDPEAGATAHGALCWSERDAVEAGFATTATRDADGWVLNGTKAFVIHGGVAQLHVVAAQIDAGEGWDGIGLFAVDGENPGLTASARSETVGLLAVPISDVTLDGCKVGEQDLLARGGAEGTREGLLRLFARIGIVNVARTLGCSRAAFEHALRYSEERKAFGKPIGHFQALAFRLADMATDIDAGRWLLWRAAVALEGGSKRWLRDTATAVVHIHELAYHTTNHAVQFLGGHGYIQDHPPEKWMRDIRTLALLGASPETMAHVLAREHFDLTSEATLGDLLPGNDCQPVLT